MNITPKQRTQMWLAGIILAALYFAPAIVGFVRQAMFYRQQTATQNPRVMGAIQAGDPRKRPALPHAPATPPVAGSDAPAVGANAPTADPNASAQFDNLLGVWQGTGPLPGHGMCMLRFELRKNTDVPGGFSGFPVLACNPILPGFVRRGANSPNPILEQMSPLSAVLTGTPKDGSIPFSVDKIIGKSVSGCAMTAFTVTPFGTDQIAAEWQEGTCQGGQVLLRRAGK